MSEYDIDDFEDDYADDSYDEIEYDTWQCVKCLNHFIDPEVWPKGEKWAGKTVKLEVQMYWLDVKEPVCSDCAAKSGIPPVDKE